MPSFFEMLQNKQISLSSTTDRTVVVIAEHTVGEKGKVVESVLLGVDKDRPLSLVEQQSLLLQFNVALYGRKRRNLAVKRKIKGEFLSRYPGRQWYWLLPAAAVKDPDRPSPDDHKKVDRQVVADLVNEYLYKWREKLLPYVLDEAMPLPWEEDGIEEDGDEDPQKNWALQGQDLRDAVAWNAALEPKPAAPKVPTNDELMAMWLASQGKAAPQPQVLNYNLPQATPPKLVKIG